MAICGPKCSLCCSILSIWGVIQLGIMGVLFWVKSVAFLEDMGSIELPTNLHQPDDLDKYYQDVDDAYTQNAYNCWIAAGVYGLTFLISVQQFWANTRSRVKV